ncbi:class I adenylate-forming enzyme family protein [Gordonia sp. OPL2]|uniref:class I adenylate-forming enzyme family protein n=1 Tax=Gordonia sp. OPL2 TaxID=2486274 RepID=UPI0016556712|nr:AMP-binding protein [Gordonia sp. OPL2]ROZ84114.1 long-chain fatty acid--CoA ligase [Gordonia sp. OPL2]
MTTALSPRGSEDVIVDDTLAEAWARRVRDEPDAPALAYRDRKLTVREVDDLADALADALSERGVDKGSRVGVHLQNVPQYALIFVALWKLGAIGVLINPMYFGRELHGIVDDAEPVGIIAGDRDVERVRASLTAGSAPWVIGTSDSFDPTDDELMTLVHRHIGGRPPAVDVTGDDIALLVYTSGTTGPPKGAMNSHANIMAVASSFARLGGIGSGSVAFALAPLFHITGAVLLGALPLVQRAELVLAGRFAPDAALDAIRDHRVTYTIGSITAFTAMMNSPHAQPDHFASATSLFSGGAPVPQSTVIRFQERFGRYIHNAYGMTETSSGVIAVAPGTIAPAEPDRGTLSVGKPLDGVHAVVVDADDRPLGPGAEGELVLSGPQIISGYWRNPDASTAAIPGGRLHTGDVAMIDDDGWVYIVDRMKDQINVSGYKVWPREVEDVLYEHPAVLEAAVVGVPDDYQGESVVAYVSVREGFTVSGAELIDFARDRLAAYKRPRRVEFVDDLPKTQTGKIQRRLLRSPES